jgi:hypothetical protein
VVVWCGSRLLGSLDDDDPVRGTKKITIDRLESKRKKRKGVWDVID